MKHIANLGLLVMLSGCSLFGGSNTIGGLKSQEAEESSLDFRNMDHEQVREEYQELLTLVDDEFLKEQIQRRIAGVSMAEGDYLQTSSVARPEKGYYREAINSYIDILEKYPNSPDNAEVLYQLSKAYEMEGEPKNAEAMLKRLVALHPDYSGIAEAHFRLGDINFNNGNYKQAEFHYRTVTQANAPSLKLNSHYMLGWALYKRGLFDEALESFAFVLAQVLEAPETTTTEKPMLKDTLHSISLALVNVGGAAKIQDISGLSNKAYQWQVYEDLGAYYLEKNRYADSAATYRNFIERFPMDARTPGMHSQQIASFVKGAFAKDVLLAKQDYVARYGMTSAYWEQASEPVKADISATLKPYLTELAAHFHGQAQQQAKLAGEKEAARVKGADELNAKSGESYQQATQYYADYLASFPQAADVARQRFLKAEAHFEAQQFAAAAADYEIVSYQYKDKEFGNRAGYAAILAYQKNIALLENKPADKAREQENAVASMLRFAAAYDTDERSPAVLTNAAEHLFSLNRYQQAIEVADGLIKGNQKLDQNLKQTAYGLMAHSYFQLKQYAEAEQNYDHQRALLGKQHADYVAVSERMATAVYKKAEVMTSAGQKLEAAAQLLRIKTIAPDSKVRVIAQYDAAITLLTAEQWQGAINELVELRALYPQHELAAQFPRKLAYGYEQAGQLKAAAETYEGLYKADKDANVRRDALFAAAMLREKLGNKETALEYFKTWARDYEDPFDNRMEARYHIATLYGELKDETRKLFWLRRIIEGDAKAGEQRTDRSRWLAAWAATEYGDYFAGEFSKRRLSANLERNLPLKNQSLQDAATRYQQAAEYGLLEFTTQASFKIARLYQQMADELNTLPVPKELSEQDAAMFRDIIAQQSAPMLELAVSVYQSNAEQGWKGHFNPWIDDSFKALARLQPARFNKTEIQKRYGDEIR
ncbi:tetratricopeptide repeat protein [Thalassolituus sp. LLYu03]|uniref:tetratricopeptide repeat protein n=1 Tax=Thalassolituus sp. LLYu03 TaxID=3421656 RepID=UPI003D2D0FBA